MGGTPSDALPADTAPAITTPPTAQFPAEDFACTTSDDCCVVYGECADRLALVTAKNQAQTTAAFQAKAAADRRRDAAPWEACWPCVPPAVEVSCVASRCVAERVERKGLPGDSRLQAPHCGALSRADGGAPATRLAQTQVAGQTPPTFSCH